MLRTKTIIFAIALIASLLTIIGCGADNYARKAEEFYAIGEYFDAAEEYKKAYSHTPVKEKDKRGERAWKMAESYRHIGYSAKAAGGYQNAVRYKAGGPEAILRLAQMQHWMGKYNDAIKNYKYIVHPQNKAELEFYLMEKKEKDPGFDDKKFMIDLYLNFYSSYHLYNHLLHY